MSFVQACQPQTVTGACTYREMPFRPPGATGVESCKFRSSEDMDLRASLCHQAFGLGQSRAWAWESGLISLFHRALASSDLLSFSVPGVPAMAASFHAPRRLSWLQQHGAQGAWGRGTAPKGISGAGVAKKAAMSVCKYSPGRGILHNTLSMKKVNQ